MHCMVSQLLSMLRYLQNEHSIMHRDIKPSNIMITPHSILKLIDFGLSFSGMLTKGYCGTRGYIAPEIIKNVSYTKKCDIFSVGAVIFEIVSGYPPIINSKSNSLESHIYENQFILPPNLFWADVGFY